MKHQINLDHAATTSISAEALAEMLPYFAEFGGNPSSIHGAGRAARRAVEIARKRVASAIGAKPEEIYFTSGGTESDNWAIVGNALNKDGGRIITSSIEHHAVLRTCEWLEKRGYEIIKVPVDGEGLVDPDDVRKALTGDTILISIMMANNEVGTIEPVEEIGSIAKENGIPFHSDAVQAVGAIPVDVNAIQADFMSLSSHKFYGPKGIGALYIRTGQYPTSLLHGGEQERGRRAGTENLPGIVGMGKAIELAVVNMETEGFRTKELRDYLAGSLLEMIPGARLNGSVTKRLPNNCHFSVEGIESEALLLRMDLEGIHCSGGSACTAGSIDPSHVLMAMGQTPERAKGGIRMTLGRENTEEEMVRTVEVLERIVRDLRSVGV